MRLLLYCDDPGCGGTAVNAGLLAADLVERGLEVFLAASVDITGQAPGVTYVPIDYDTMRFSDKTAHSRNEPEGILMAVRPGLVIFCDGAPDSSLAAKAVCQDFGLPYVVYTNFVAAFHLAELGGRIAEVRRAYAAALAVVAVSQENLTLLRLVCNVPLQRSRVIVNGRPDKFFEPASEAERRTRRDALGLLPTDVLCLTVARYEPRKGYRHLLRAASLLADHPARARLRFAAIGHDLGGGRLDLEAMIAAAGLANRVTVLGQRDDVREWLGAADVVALPSESEGMPLSLIEAMGQGLPVIASAVSGIPELLGDTGILLPDPNNNPEATAQALAMALAFLAENPAIRRSMGQAAKIRARSHFTSSAMLEAWAGLAHLLAPAVGVVAPRTPYPADHVPPHSAPFSRDIVLNDDPSTLEYIKEGWSHAEPKGRWTEGGRARLAFWLPPQAQKGFVLELAGFPFRGKGDAPLALTITVCDRELARVVWPGGPKSLDMALACLPRAGGLLPKQADIVFSIEGATSPAFWGLSDDARLLGLFVARLRLLPLPQLAGALS